MRWKIVHGKAPILEESNTRIPHFPLFSLIVFILVTTVFFSSLAFATVPAGVSPPYKMVDQPQTGQGISGGDGNRGNDAETDPTLTVYRATAIFAPETLDTVYHKPAEVTHASTTTSVEYELWIEIDYMLGHEPTPYVLTYIHDYYYARGIEVTFHADLYDETGNLTHDDPFSQIVPLDENTTDQEFWATKATYNNHDFGYYSKWKWVLFGATVYGHSELAGYAYVVIKGNNGEAGNYVFIADQTSDDWALANLNETNGVTPQEKVEAVVLMHEMGHTIGILKLRAGHEFYDPDLTSVMSYVNPENCNAVDEYGNPYWYYSDNYWKLRNMEYYIISVHDVATLNVTALPTLICPGETVTVTVEVKNEGEVNETFQGTAYYNSTIIGTQWVLDLAPNSTAVLTFNWNTTSILPANYTISAAADPVPSETDLSDNTLVGNTITFLVPDVAIRAVEASSTMAVQGEIIPINVTSANEGPRSQAFEVFVYANSTAVNSTSLTLPAETSTTLTLTWNTTNATPGNYTISATAVPLFGEKNLADNTMADGTVMVVIRDVAVLNVTFSVTGVHGKTQAEIYVEVKNEGTMLTETFNVTVYANSTAIGTQTVTNLDSNASATLTFNWTIAGQRKVYIISATAGPVPGEIDLVDNTFVDGTITPVVHDVAVLSVTPSTTWVYQGNTINIYVEVKNEGTESETFTVTAYYNSTIIGTQTVKNLAPTTTTITFNWNTTGVSPAEYVISATAGPIEDEDDLTDNTLEDGTIQVRIPGDIDGDGDVDPSDFNEFRLAYGSKLGQPNYNPYADFDLDGDVDPSDFNEFRLAYGKVA